MQGNTPGPVDPSVLMHASDHACGHRFLNSCMADRVGHALDAPIAEIKRLDKTAFGHGGDEGGDVGYGDPLSTIFEYPMMFYNNYDEWATATLLERTSNDIEIGTIFIDIDENLSAGEYKIITSGSGFFEFPDKYPIRKKVNNQSHATRFISGVEISTEIDIALHPKAKKSFCCPEKSIAKTALTNASISNSYINEESIKCSVVERFDIFGEGYNIVKGNINGRTSTVRNKKGTLRSNPPEKGID